MTEAELREKVRKQIINNFHENKEMYAQQLNEDKISLQELRSLVRKELIRKLQESNSK